LPTSHEPSFVAPLHEVDYEAGRFRRREPALTRSSIALVGLLAVALAAALLPVTGAAGADSLDPKRGGTVVFGPVSESACIHPLKNCGGGGPQFFWILNKVLPGAFTIAPDFTNQPTLVSRVTFTRSAPFTLTYSIRAEARWSDGAPVTARDFVFTWRAIRQHLPAEDVHNRYVHTVRPVDAKTVRVVLRSRYAGWRSLFRFVLPQHALVGEDLAEIWTDGIENPRTGRPIGTGPFLVGDWERGKQLTLVRNPTYWGKHKAYLDRLVVRFCRASCVAPPPAEVLESVRSGAVDFAYARDTEIFSGLRRIRRTTVRLHRTIGYEHLDFRLKSGGHPALCSKLGAPGVRLIRSTARQS
jgi:ABC-type transport system substrate-binding protein